VREAFRVAVKVEVRVTVDDCRWRRAREIGTRAEALREAELVRLDEVDEV
jgi:hypothetical protein